MAVIAMSDANDDDYGADYNDDDYNDNNGDNSRQKAIALIDTPKRNENENYDLNYDSTVNLK